MRGDGSTVSVSGQGTAASPYVISANVVLGALGTPTNMVTGLNAARPARGQVWWYSATGQVPANFVQGADVLLGPQGFVTTQVLAAPLSLAQADLTSQSVQLTWAPVAGAAFYEVAYRDGSLAAGVFLSVPTAIPSLLLDLTGRTGQVQVKVRAVASNGPGLYGSLLSFTRPAAPDEGDFEDDDFAVADFH